MSVYLQPGSRIYAYKYQISNVPYRGSTGCSDKRSAERFERDHKAQTKAALTLKPLHSQQADGLSVLQAVSDYIAIQRARNDISRSTLSSEEKAFEFIVKSLGPDTRMDKVGTDQIAVMVGERKKEPRRNSSHRILEDAEGKPQRLSSSYINRYTWKLFRRVYLATRDKEWSPVRPIDWNDKRINLREAGPRKKEMRLEEEAAFVSHPSFREGYGAAFRFALLSGLRRDNFTNLTWSQVDLGNREIQVLQKGSKTHVVQIDDEMLDILMKERGHHTIFVWTYIAERSRTNPKTKCVEVRGERYPMTTAGFTSWYRRHSKRIGLTTTIHDLRRSAGGRLLRATGNLKAVSQRLGHSDIAVTARHYAHIHDNEMLAILNQANASVNTKRAAMTALLQTRISNEEAT
ncbi:phage integrase family protein [Methylobacterium sp. WL69]|uniref:tyrosine-type recombinase/integrase n=1 Tax=Methylobacterium sp. WL69 TaxID=2603893 RepID=UPI0011C72000|nr:tyrosine-type recombinase/integrase [Methylobacterium sp. WL69]TXM68967.1 phage integrase family protein [Methylobacterium sp. WL69]